jgi:hypothetical protein
MQRKARGPADERRPVAGYLSVNEAAQAACVSRRAVVKAIARGQLSAVVGNPARPNTWIVHSKDLEIWVAALA